MGAAPVPANEAERLRALRQSDILDTPEETWFDVFTQSASALFNAPIAVFSLVDHDRQWFKSKVGLDVSSTSREVSFCAHGIVGRERTFIVPNATEDDRFKDNPLVTGPTGLRFYAGVVVHGPGGLPLGSLCILDTEPRELKSEDVLELEALANGLEVVLERHAAKAYLQP